MVAPTKTPRRNKGFDETHQELIDAAVRMISERGAEAVSIAALSREVGINRTTVYYHFDSREALLHAVANWAAGQLAKGMDLSLSRPERAGLISRFALENPELVKLWIDDFVSGRDIRESYSCWDELVAGMRGTFDREWPEDDVDPEIYCVMLLTASIIGPRVYASSVRPGQNIDAVVGKFVAENHRVLRRDRIIKD